MEKSMWLRCPECERWCYAEKKDFLGRIIRSVKKGDQETGETFGKLGDYIGLKGLGKTAGRAINAVNIYEHIGEMLNGDNYRFYCKCGHQFGTDDEKFDMTEEHDLYSKAVELSKQFSSVRTQPEQEKKNYTRKVQETLAKIENTSGIDDAKATLYDILACCYFYFFNDSTNALIEINKSLDIYDDEQSHILKGLFMGNVVSPVENYKKMNELLKIKEIESDLRYVEKNTILGELEQAQKIYGSNFISIPANQRKFLVISSDYTYLPNSFKVIKYNDTDLSGIVFENGFPNNNAIYVCHPYKSTVYFPSESYQADLFKNQLNEFRELLQCLGAKSIRTENSLSTERSSYTSGNLSGNAGGEYKGIGASVSGEHKDSNSIMESMVQKMLIGDEFSFNPDMTPFIPEDLVWFDHMEEWQRLSRMRLRGQNKYSIRISSKHTHIVNDNEANQVNAEFNTLVAKGNIGISKSSELKASEENSHEWNLVVEFYPLSDYSKKPAVPFAAISRQTNTQQIESKESKKKNLITYAIVGSIVIAAALIAILLT